MIENHTYNIWLFVSSQTFVAQYLKQQIGKGLSKEDSTYTAEDIIYIMPSMQTSLIATLFNASSVFSLSFVPKQRTILSWHLLPVSLLFPSHHMVMQVWGGKSAFIQLEVQLTQCVTTRVDIVLLTMSHATAPWKSKSQMSKWWRTPGHSGHTM